MLTGYLLEIKEVDPQEMLTACIASVVATTHLEKILYNCLKEID